jgi:HEAT repeat protein
LEAIIKAFGTSVVDALARFHPEATPDQRAEALRAMGDAGEPATVQDLIRGLDDEDDLVGAAAHEALVRVTLQDFGREPEPWLEWWELNRGRHRIEWLIDALVHNAPEIRRAAGEDLRAQSRQYFAYSPDLPPRERERAQQRYRDWWITEGRSRHVRP